jgi:hypothetical protein
MDKSAASGGVDPVVETWFSFGQQSTAMKKHHA